MKRTLIALFTLTLMTTMASCGGGSGGGGIAAVAPPNPPPANGSGGTTGPVTGFGSVFVNGVEFATDASTVVTVDGDNTATENDLRVGEIVTIDGTVNADGVTGSANTIVHANNVKGPIASIDLANTTLVVLGQQIATNADTVFDSAIQPNDLTGLNVNDIIEVSGFVDSNGTVVATYIERKSQQTSLEVTGSVSALDANNSTFVLGTLMVDFTNATLSGFGTANIQNGDFVEAKGDALGASGELMATRVEKTDNGELSANDEGKELEVEGLITRFVDATDFDVNATQVTTNTNTVFEGGSASALAVNGRVEVEGTVDSNGVLVADKVSIKAQSDSKVNAIVDSIDPQNNRFTLLGVTVTTNAVTQLQDDSDANTMRFSLADLAVNDYVSVSGIADTNDPSMLLATRVERDNAEVEVKLKGAVVSVADPQLTVLNVAVTTDASTQFKDASEAVVSAAQFFALVGVGTRVEIKGQENPDNAILASQVKIESASGQGD